MSVQTTRRGPVTHITLNNPDTGTDTEKAAIWIDGNIHGNEVQAADTCLYTIWYLTRSHGNIDALTELMRERSFYFVPSSNPDGRMYWFEQASTPNILRGGIRPTDNDRRLRFDVSGVADQARVTPRKCSISPREASSTRSSTSSNPLAPP